MTGQNLIDQTTSLSNQAREFGYKIQRMEYLIAHLLYKNGYKTKEVCKLMKWKCSKENFNIIKGSK